MSPAELSRWQGKNGEINDSSRLMDSAKVAEEKRSKLLLEFLQNGSINNTLSPTRGVGSSERQSSLLIHGLQWLGHDGCAFWSHGWESLTVMDGPARMALQKNQRFNPKKRGWEGWATFPQDISTQRHLIHLAGRRFRTSREKNTYSPQCTCGTHCYVVQCRDSQLFFCSWSLAPSEPHLPLWPPS